MFADADARRFYPLMTDAAAAMRWIERSLERYDDQGFGLWVIECSETGAFLGDCGLTYQPVEEEERLEVGYHLQRGHRGNGFATEAARACLAYAFDTLGEPTVCSIVHPDNAGSNAVAARVHVDQRTFRGSDGAILNLYWTDRGVD